MASEQITFYDLPSRPPRSAWSLNPWKTRFVLNYKNLNYKTEWTEYPDVKPKFQDRVPPNKEGAAYTIPVIRLPDGTFIMDSWPIAHKLEELHPSPSLKLDAPQVSKIIELMSRLMSNLAGIYVPEVPKRLLNDASAELFNRTREERFGMPLDQLQREKGGEVGLNQAEPILKEITALMTATTDGPFFAGKDVTYADFIWGGALIFFQRIGDDVLQGILGKTGDPKAHLNLLEALKPWSERADY